MKRRKSYRGSKRSYQGRNSLFVRESSVGLVRFEEPSLGLIPGANFSDVNSEDVISKKALIIVEGEHKDNSGKKHIFTPNDIEWFAESTNDFLDGGGRVPWQADHNKSQKHNLGDLESYIVTKTIAPEDLPNPKLGNLVGKVGAFATELVAKGKDVVEQVRAGRIKTLSPGIDMATGIIREISATPTPAIVGMSIFSQGKMGGSAVNWEEAESHKQMDDSLKEDYDRLTQILWEITGNILNASDEEIPLNSREKFYDKALVGFSDRLSKLLGLNSTKDPGIPVRGSKTPGLKDSVEARHPTQKLTLSANLDTISRFNRSQKRRRRRR